MLLMVTATFLPLVTVVLFAWLVVPTASFPNDNELGATFCATPQLARQKTRQIRSRGACARTIGTDDPKVSRRARLVRAHWERAQAWLRMGTSFRRKPFRNQFGDIRSLD